MTDVITETCTRCGAGIQGTNFCENCGMRAASSISAATPSAITTASTYAATRPSITAGVPLAPRRVNALHVVTLLFVLAGWIVPTIMSLLPPTDNEYQLRTNVIGTLDAFVGLFALLAAVTARSRTAAKVGGAILALAYVTVAMLYDFTSIFYASTVIVDLAGSFIMLLLFLSWGVSRPFRGPGYFGSLVLAAFELADVFLVQAVYGAGQIAGAVLDALIGIVFVLGTVGLSVLFERTSATAQTGVSSNRAIASPLSVGGAANGKAKASLTMALIALGLNALSRFIGYWPGITISIVALALLVLAIVFGHLARREIRLSGQRGAGMALAGLLMGYIVLGLDVALIVAAFVFTAALISAF